MQYIKIYDENKNNPIEILEITVSDGFINQCEKISKENSTSSENPILYSSRLALIRHFGFEPYQLFTRQSIPEITNILIVKG